LTYCVGILLDDGLVLASDSRTNAGIDRVSTFGKMHVFERPGDRVFVILTAGNLSMTQGVINLLGERLDTGDPTTDLFASVSMFVAARAVGGAVQEMRVTSAGYCQQSDIDFSCTLLFGGQIAGGPLRLFMIYPEGNFIEALGDTVYFQIGEVKYGKPILDRLLTRETRLLDAAKCALISFDSTMRSNVSVGPPIDLAIIRRDALRLTTKRRLDEGDDYLLEVRRTWGEAIVRAFRDNIPEPDWPI
jgi:putative proteasome-type protease